MRRYFFLLLIIIACNEKESTIPQQPKTAAYIFAPSQAWKIEDYTHKFKIKVSPDMGSETDIAYMQELSPGESLGMHHHSNADETIYVIEGTGTASFQNNSHRFRAGDLIFFPRNADHNIANLDSATVLRLLFFMNQPGFVNLIKERQKQFEVEGKSITLEALNAIAEKYGTHYKTIK